MLAPGGSGPRGQRTTRACNAMAFSDSVRSHSTAESASRPAVALRVLCVLCWNADASRSEVSECVFGRRVVRRFYSASREDAGSIDVAGEITEFGADQVSSSLITN
jgi:hypothetical protein